jgi:hypothetical protein
MKRFSPFCALGSTLIALSGCNTVTDLVTSKLPESHSGRPMIVVSLREQEAYLYRGGHRTASSRISSGREGRRTPIGRFQVIRKDEDHRSSLYGDYVDASGRIVKANVDSRRDSKPPHSHFVGTPMPYFLEFSPGYGLHQGYLPGVPASHGCIRMPYWKARRAKFRSGEIRILDSAGKIERSTSRIEGRECGRFGLANLRSCILEANNQHGRFQKCYTDFRIL